MARVHFVSAHFGGSMPWKKQISSENHEVSVAYYDDKNTASRHLSMHPRLKAKIHKMLQWRFVDSDWYVWMDSSVKLIHPDPASYIIDAVGKAPLCLFKHTSANSIVEEASRVLYDLQNHIDYAEKRYLGEPIREQVINYLSDPNFIDNKLFGMTFFAYHSSISHLMQEWFLHNLTWSIQDQISFPYVLYKSGVEYSLFDGTIDGENKLFEWDWRTREENLLF